MRHFFLRDASRRPVACIATALVYHESAPPSVRWAISICNPLDQFDRKKAILIAQARLAAGKSWATHRDVPPKRSIMQLLAHGQIGGLLVPKRVAEAARLWLKFDANRRTNTAFDTMREVLSSPVPASVPIEQVCSKDEASIPAEHANVDAFETPATFDAGDAIVAAVSTPNSDYLDAMREVAAANHAQVNATHIAIPAAEHRFGNSLDVLFDEHPPEAEKPWSWADAPPAP